MPAAPLVADPKLPGVHAAFWQSARSSIKSKREGEKISRRWCCWIRLRTTIRSQRDAIWWL